MASEDPNLTFMANGKEISMRRSAVTAERLGRFFNFAISSVYIKEGFGNRVEYPNQHGKFNFSSINPWEGFEFEVYGEEPGHTGMVVEQGASSFAMLTPPSTSATTVAKRPWASTTLSNSDSTKEQVKCKASVKVILADLVDGKVVTNTSKPKQSFVPLYNEEQANVTYITAFVNTSMKEKDLVLVGNNGIEFAEEAGTRGTAFWKKGARKVFAIPRKPKRRSRSQYPSSDSDNSDFEVYKKAGKQRKTSNWDAIGSQLLDIEGELQEMRKALNDTKSDINKVITLSNDTSVPLAVKNAVKESFECIICKTAPMNPPIIVSRCCGNILGCNTCVDTWYGTGASVFDKSCPHCRAERAYSNTFRLMGIDGFLDKLREICNSEP